jgi:hypothetical protein
MFFRQIIPFVHGNALLAKSLRMAVRAADALSMHY